MRIYNKGDAREAAYRGLKVRICPNCLCETGQVKLTKADFKSSKYKGYYCMPFSRFHLGYEYYDNEHYFCTECRQTFNWYIPNLKTEVNKQEKQDWECVAGWALLDGIVEQSMKEPKQLCFFGGAK
jgi:hypothetical protein